MGKFIIIRRIISKNEIVATLRHRPSPMLGKRLNPNFHKLGRSYGLHGVTYGLHGL